VADETGYASLTVDQLSTELERRGLPKSGKKDDLITRLVDDDTAQGNADEAVGVEETVEASAAEPTAAAEPEEPAAEPEEPASGRRRRGSAETSARTGTGTDAEAGAVRVPCDANGLVDVRAHARYVRTAPRKARLVMDHIRGKRVDDARALLRHTPRRAAVDISKLLESAVANAENNFELDPDDLRIKRCYVDEGPTIKRYRPRAQGRATPIDKRTSHMTITLTTNES
jgi:ribosomal protein L22